MGSSVENEGVQSGLGTWKHEREISKFKSQEFRGMKIPGGDTSPRIWAWVWDGADGGILTSLLLPLYVRER